MTALQRVRDALLRALAAPARRVDRRRGRRLPARHDHGRPAGLDRARDASGSLILTRRARERPHPRRPDHRVGDRGRARVDRRRDGPQAGADVLLLDHPRVGGLRLRDLRRRGAAARGVLAVDPAPVRPDPRLHPRHQPPLCRARRGVEARRRGHPQPRLLRRLARARRRLRRPDLPRRRARRLLGDGRAPPRPRRADPGSCGIVDATDAYAEGLQFNAIKIEEEGRRNDWMWRFIRDNVAPRSSSSATWRHRSPPAGSARSASRS